jgi:hypothetical protein
VLLVMPEQWPRALLRAALREVGYDALGAPGLPGAMRYRTESPGRGRVRLILVDASTLAGEGAGLLPPLLRRHAAAATLLLTRAIPSPPAADAVTPPWTRVVRRPVSIADLVAAIQAILPLPPEWRHPID